MENYVETVLMNIGFKPCRKGYGQFVCAIMLIIQYPHLRKVTAEIYPMVAKMMNITACSVERNIRDLINDVWKHGDAKMFKQIFGNYDENYPPYGKDFLFTIARRQEIEWRGKN